MDAIGQTLAEPDTQSPGPGTVVDNHAAHELEANAVAKSNRTGS